MTRIRQKLFVYDTPLYGVGSAIYKMIVSQNISVANKSEMGYNIKCKKRATVMVRQGELEGGGEVEDGKTDEDKPLERYYNFFFLLSLVL